MKVLIIDMPHLFNKYAFGGVGKLSYKGVDTTLASYVIKQIFRWSKGCGVICCFDGDGDVDFVRKRYFMEIGVEYKGKKKIWARDYLDGVDLTRRLLEDGGVCCLGKQGYTSADMVFAAVCGLANTGIKIDIVTGDVDLCSLVEPGITVFLQSKRNTWAFNKSEEKRGYFQVFPENYQSYLSSLTEFKGFEIGYNTLLLHRIFRGDRGLGLKGIKGVTPKRYHEILGLLGGVCDMSVAFRHDAPNSEYIDTITGQRVDREYALLNKGRVVQKYMYGDILINLVENLKMVGLQMYVEDVCKRYTGICLNNVFYGVIKRRPYVYNVERGFMYDFVTLAESVLRYGIHLD